MLAAGHWPATGDARTAATSTMKTRSASQAQPQQSLVDSNKRCSFATQIHSAVPPPPLQLVRARTLRHFQGAHVHASECMTLYPHRPQGSTSWRHGQPAGQHTAADRSIRWLVPPSVRAVAPLALCISPDQPPITVCCCCLIRCPSLDSGGYAPVVPARACYTQLAFAPAGTWADFSPSHVSSHRRTSASFSRAAR